jgi:ketosteroid isomerase-like protein
MSHLPTPDWAASLLAITLLLPAPVPPTKAPGALDESARRDIERTLLDLEDQWIKVYETHDLKVLHRVIADDFVATLSDGAMRGKAEHIAAYAADFGTWSAVANSDLRVHVYGPEIAVVTGLYTARLREAKGSEPTERYRYTDTWVRRGDTWLCVATQETRVP